MVTLRLFAAAADAAGSRRVELDATTVRDALAVARDTFGPGFTRTLAICQIVVGEDVVPQDDARELPRGEEVAVLPPVSGGQDARMLDVGDREETRRSATASALVRCAPATRDRLMAGTTEKGDAKAPARIAGILAAKRTPELLPLCHPVRTTGVDVTITADGEDAILVIVTVRGVDRTGFEMEALTGASVAALSLIDVGKREDPAMRIERIRIEEKHGGRNGSWFAP